MRDSNFLKVLQGEPVTPPPVWFMRQAGRYLPEYRAVRQDAGSFLNLCFSPEQAAEVTLQPIRRYDLDAAILFADILLIPMVMGQDLKFETGEGPRLRPALQEKPSFSLAIDKVREKLAPVMETIRLVRSDLQKDKALIGFAGAPWTVATYMIAGQGVKDPSALRQFAYEHEAVFDALMQQLEAATIIYLKDQIEAGVDAVQLFESWASGLPPAFSRKYCLGPMKRIAEALKADHPDIPVIAFPKGAGTLVADYAAEKAFSGIGLGTETDPVWVKEYLSPHIAVQGCLDPLLVVQGGVKMRDAVKELRETFAGVPHIFNLGHGFVPQTPPEHVAELVELIRQPL